MRALHAAIDAGVNFIDTADVYGDGRSERLVARLRRERPGETIYVATKAGRRLPKQTAEGYSRENLDRVGRAQPEEPRDRRDRPAAAPLPAPDGLRPARGLRRPRRPRRRPASSALRRQRRDAWTRRSRRSGIPNVQTVQIIFNMFRLKPAEAFFPEAQAAAGRHPRARAARQRAADRQADGPTSTFAADDHRAFNRDGEAFDEGETFSGVPLRRRARRPSRSLRAAGARQARRWPSSRCAGS